MCREIFARHFFHDSNTSGNLINRVKYFWIPFRFRQNIWSQSLKKFDSAVCMTLRSKYFRLSKSKIFFQTFSFMIDVFTPKRIFLIVPLKAIRDQQNFSIWLLSLQYDSVVWCTPQSFTPRWDGHGRAWLHGRMRTTEFFEKFGALYSAVGCTPRR